MIEIEAQPMFAIEQWSLAESGLKARIVNACHADSIQTVGELRRASPARLLKLPHFGKRSLNDCQTFHAICDRLAEGNLHISNLREWMETFISPDGFEVISSRYGFYRSDPGAERKFFTLQDIANRTGRSRERIRQVEEMSTATLAKKLPRAGLRAFAHKISAWLETQDHASNWAAFESLSHEEEWAGASPASIALYLGDQLPEILTVRSGYASRIPEERLEKYRTTAMSCIQNLSRPVSLSQLTEKVRSDFPDVSLSLLRKFFELEFQQATDLMCTLNGAYCGSRSICLTQLLEQELHTPKTSLHFRDLTRRINRQLSPGQAVGAGTVLRALAHRKFRRLDFGLYTLNPDG